MANPSWLSAVWLCFQYFLNIYILYPLKNESHSRLITLLSQMPKNFSKDSHWIWIAIWHAHKFYKTLEYFFDFLCSVSSRKGGRGRRGSIFLIFCIQYPVVWLLVEYDSMMMMSCYTYCAILLLLLFKCCVIALLVLLISLICIVRSSPNVSLECLSTLFTSRHIFSGSLCFNRSLQNWLCSGVTFPRKAMH